MLELMLEFDDVLLEVHDPELVLGTRLDDLD